MLRQSGEAVCKCGHNRDAHAHYRRGTDCALCQCRRWRRAGPLYQMLRRYTR